MIERSGFFVRRAGRLAMILLIGVALSGCAALAGKLADRLSASLTQGVINHDDPETVAEGLPAYLILLDGLIANDPKNAGLLLAGAKLYSAYAGGFVIDTERRKRLADRGFDYARRGVCARNPALCGVLGDGAFELFAHAIADQKADAVEALYVLAASWAGWVQADTSDWARIADLPRIEAVLNRVSATDPHYDHGNVLAYLGVLDCLRPESLGGNPVRGSQRLLQAFAIGEGNNLMPKALLAEQCARLLFDQETHDRVLNEVLAADARADGFTLSNTIAQRRARELLESGKDYF
jgi:hypothetical protein